jgi:hypothetical protein
MVKLGHDAIVTGKEHAWGLHGKARHGTGSRRRCPNVLLAPDVQVLEVPVRP